MHRCRALAALAALLSLTALAEAADLTKIDRAIAKEPAYKTKAPKYCLLVFGPEADYRVWLVLDGDTLYVDRNGNGDLTEPGESTDPAERNTDPCVFKPIAFLRPDGRTEEKLDFFLCGWFNYEKGKVAGDFMPALTISWQGRKFGSTGDETGPPVWGERPEEALVLHVGGPLQMGFDLPERHAVHWTRDGVQVTAAVGTKGLGSGSFVALGFASDAIPKDVSPTAVLEFPPQSQGGPPVVAK